MQFHESKGVKFHMQAKVDKIVPSDSDSSLASAVVVTGDDGKSTTLQADVVVMGVGVAPATEYLKSSKGFEQVLERGGGVYVDEFLQVKGVPDVYAIGMSLFVSCQEGLSRRMGCKVILRCTRNLALASRGGSNIGT